MAQKRGRAAEVPAALSERWNAEGLAVCPLGFNPAACPACARRPVPSRAGRGGGHARNPAAAAGPGRGAAARALGRAPGAPQGSS